MIIHDNIDTFCEKNSVNKAAFAAWESSIEQTINLKIENLQPKFHNHSNAIPVLQSSKKASNEIQQKYVTMPIDKASGNIALVCERIYPKVLVSELGLIQNGNSTYSKESKPVDNIIKDHEKHLSKKFGITLSLSQKLLPHIYCLPKLHKNPTKFRFIIAAASCSIKALAKDITAILKLFQLQLETYNKKCHFFFRSKNILGHQRQLTSY